MPAPRPIYGVSVDQITLTASTALSIFELRTPSTTGIVPILWWVEFDGVTATNAPVKVDVGIFSAATTTPGTSTTPTTVNYGNRGLASQCTCYYNTASEGAGTLTGETHRVPPTSGLIWQESLGQEWTVAASSYWRIRCTASAAVNASFGIRWAE